MSEAALQQLGVTADEYVNFMGQRIQGRRLLYACLTLLLYDYLLTLRREIVDVWQREPRFSIAKVLFGLNRYYPILVYIIRVWIFSQTVFTKFICERMIPFTGWSATVNFALVEIVLMLRVWALYGKSRKVGILFIALFIGALSSSFALRKLHPNGMYFAPMPPESLTQCTRSTPEEYFWLYLIGIFVETTIFALLVTKARAYSLRTSGTPLITALVQHGTVYYAVVLATLVLATASTVPAVLYQPIADANLIVAVTSVACNRLILSLRGLYFNRGALGSTAITTGPSTTRKDDIPLGNLPRPLSFGRGRAPRPHHQHQLSTFTETDIEGGISISRVGKHTS